MSHVIVLVLFTVCFASLTLADEAPNNCHDPASWQDWNDRVKQHPDDTELHTLHALWLGLCVKVERGDVSLDDAITIFENARSTLIQQRQDEKREKKPPAPL
uniref:Uncharacterized protein n=1 Tax=uncultured soil microorganism TaxID=1457551 RepID=A0A088CQQ1_9ZZZZ|nr:hypothetical protein [uncultured soil microorganism]